MSRFLPVAVLVLLAPVIAELLYGTVAPSQAVAVLFVVPIYGSGALLIRELVRRSGRGWASILLLGVAYAIVEEGLALQSFFNPTLYGAAEWGARLFGINGVYLEAMLPLHAVWSVALPILIADLLFPEARSRPYLGRLGLAVAAAFFVLGVAILVVSARTSLSPGYTASSLQLGGAAAGALALAAVSLVALPKARTGDSASAGPAGGVPSPGVAFLVSGLGSFAVLALLILLGRAQPAFAAAPLVAVPMLGALGVVGIVAWLIHRWSRVRGWGDHQLFGLASGALVAHTLVGLLDPGIKDRPGLAVLGVLMLVGLSLLALRIQGTRLAFPASGRYATRK